MAIVLDGTSGVAFPAGGTGNPTGAVVGTTDTQTLTNKTINASQLVAGSVTATQLATAVQPLGVGQTWQDVSGSRTAGVTYTNSTGRPIMVSIRTAATATDFTITVSGLVVAHASGSTATRTQLITVVPNGSTYVVSGYQGGSWVELR